MDLSIEIIGVLTGVLLGIVVSLVVYIWKTRERGIQKIELLIQEIERKRDESNLGYELKNEKIEGDVEKRMAALEKEVRGLQLNYLDRFEDVKKILSDNHEEQIKAIGGLTTSIKLQTQFCQQVQNQKKTVVPRKRTP